MKRYNEKNETLGDDMIIVASYMDDATREDLHQELAPCSDETFLKAYCEKFPDFETFIYNEFGIEL